MLTLLVRAKAAGVAAGERLVGSVLSGRPGLLVNQMVIGRMMIQDE
jgi:hypothetical protein